MLRPLSLLRGQIAFVDEADYPALSQYRWRLNPVGYAVRSFTLDGHEITIGMHREILQPPTGHYVLHVDGNRLNNSRANLRLVTAQEHQSARQRFKNNQTGFKGVIAQHGKWHARLQIAGRLLHLGFYEERRDAALAYDYAAQRLVGPYVLLNLPGEPLPLPVQAKVEILLAGKGY